MSSSGLCRLVDARSTNDLDVFLDTGAPAAEWARVLARQTQGARIGRYTYRVAGTGLGTTGHLDSARVDLEVVDGARVVTSFSIDVAGGVTLNAGATRHHVRLPATVPGYPATIGIALYPLENQLADKLCALDQAYGQGRASTRYHDLYDAALIVDQLAFDPATLRAALATQYQLRSMRPIAADLPEPASGWADAYNRTVRKLAGTRPPFTEFAAARDAVHRRVGPTLKSLA